MDLLVLEGLEQDPATNSPIVLLVNLRTVYNLVDVAGTSPPRYSKHWRDYLHVGAFADAYADMDAPELLKTAQKCMLFFNDRSEVDWATFLILLTDLSDYSTLTPRQQTTQTARE